MEKESVYSSPFGFEHLESTGMPEADLDKIKAEEKKLRKDGNQLQIIGGLTLIGGVISFILANIWGLGGSLEFLLAIGTAFGIGGIGFGLVKLIRKVLRKKILSFPKLRLRRKTGSRSVAAEEKPFEETTYMPKKLTKSRKSKVFSGVAGGLAEYAGISPTFMRLLFLLAFFLTSGFPAFIAYIILSFLMPSGNEPEPRKSGKVRAYH